VIGEMRAQLKRIMDRVDELSLRERTFVFLGVLGIMYVVAMYVVIQPLSGQRVRLDRELNNKREQIQTAERQMQTMLTGDVIGDDVPKRARLEALRAQVKTFDAEFGQATSGLVTPKEMARLVEGFLSNRRGLQVVKVESLPPEPVQDGQSAPVAGQAKAGPAIYKHGMRVELHGGYFEMIEYLRGLEQLPWKVFWGQVSLQAEYPTSKLTFVIYTLSTREGWIGT
jgi:MSHA biogenesis protein MshJ